MTFEHSLKMTRIKLSEQHVIKNLPNTHPPPPIIYEEMKCTAMTSQGSPLYFITPNFELESVQILQRTLLKITRIKLIPQDFIQDTYQNNREDFENVDFL